MKKVNSAVMMVVATILFAFATSCNGNEDWKFLSARNYISHFPDCIKLK
jgi:hypothetical protein